MYQHKHLEMLESCVPNGVRGTLIDCSLQAAVNGFESFYAVLRARFHQLQSQGLDKIKQLTGRLSNAELELHL